MAEGTPHRDDDDRQQQQTVQKMPEKETSPTEAPHVQKPQTHSSPKPKQEPASEPQSQATGHIHPAHHHYSTVSTPSVTLPSLSLPPIRAMDGQHPLPSHQPHHPPPLQSSVSPGPPSHVPNYFNPATNHMSLPGQSPHGHYDSAQQAMGMRYPFSHQHGIDQRVMSGGRHKKEIKRRTKTGCLTCRKRRIKCDEAHPFCNNCKKSKRDCLGYDPMFKSTVSANLQPAQPAATLHALQGQSVSPPATHHYSQAVHTPQQHQGQQPVKPIGHIVEPMTSVALGSALPKMTAYHGNRSPLITADYKPPKRITVDDLFRVGGYPPTSPPPVLPEHTLPEASVSEIQAVFTNDYAPALDELLETTWYSTKGWFRLIVNKPLLNYFAHVLNQFRKTSRTGTESEKQMHSLEMKLLWQLMCMIRPFQSAAPTTGTHTNGALPPLSAIDANGSTADNLQVKELLPRLDILEHLITGQQLRDNPVSLADYPPHLPDLKYWEVEFWRLLGVFLTMRASDPNPEESRRLEENLRSVRVILALKENRDILYSIMVTRHFGPRVPGFPKLETPDVVQKIYETPGEDEVPIVEEGTELRLWMAKDFLEKEGNGGHGTNRVIRRVAQMACRSWELLHLEP